MDVTMQKVTNQQEAARDDTAPSRQEWIKNLSRMGKRDGFYEELGDQHSALFIRRGKTLLVTFENLDHVYQSGDTRMPWAFGYVESRNWSMLGLMAHEWTWYRDEKVFDFFDRLKAEGFFEGFDNVVFYGASMGAYAACVFSAAAPGATVICISPQATLDRTVTSWETRYHRVWRRDFTGRYAYAPDMVAKAGAVHLFFDPFAQLDAMHASLFRSANVTKYNCRFMGHRVASLWQLMGILKPVTEGCVEGTLTPKEFYRLTRARRDNSRFQKELLGRLLARKRDGLIALYCRRILQDRRAPIFRREMNAAIRRMRHEKEVVDA